MRLSRLYVAEPLALGASLSLNDDNAHYLRNVLRLKAPQSLIVFNGQGGEYVAQLQEVGKKTVRLQMTQWIDRDVESPLSLHLGLGISRGDRMDWAMQKAVELGVTQITPLISSRCVIKLDDDKKQQRHQHWQHIVQHASEQSGRTVLPALHPISNLPAWLGCQTALKVFLDPYAAQSLNELQPETPHITLLSGPEGGFADDERESAKAAGFVPVRLGPRILRTETAVLAALTAVQTLWGDWRG